MFYSVQRVLKILASKDAKKFYVNCLAAGLRAKDCVMTTATSIRRTQTIFWLRRRRSTARERMESFEDESEEMVSETAEEVE